MVAYKGFGAPGSARRIDVNSGAAVQRVDWDANSYIIAWEDRPLNLGDRDYQDMVILMNQIVPVPEPGTYIAGLLLAGPVLVNALRLIRRRRDQSSQG